MSTHHNESYQTRTHCDERAAPATTRLKNQTSEATLDVTVPLYDLQLSPSFVKSVKSIAPATKNWSWGMRSLAPTYHPKWSRHYMAQNEHLEPCKTSSTFTTYIACKKNCLRQHLSFRPTCFVICTKYCACHGDAKMSDVLYLPRNKEEVLTLQKCRISCPQQNIHSSKKRTRHARENATLQFRGLLVARILIRSRNFRATIFRRHKPLISP